MDHVSFNENLIETDVEVDYISAEDVLVRLRKILVVPEGASILEYAKEIAEKAWMYEELFK